MSGIKPVLQVRIDERLRQAFRNLAAQHPELTFGELVEDALGKYLIDNGIDVSSVPARKIHLRPGRRPCKHRLDPSFVVITDDESVFAS
jgi:hypothetical protein